MAKDRDPLGKRALFSGGAASEAGSTPAPVPSRAPTPSRKPGPLDVTVECSACHETSTTNVPEIAVKHVPVVAWLPWRKRPLLMRCPACGRLAWHAVHRL